MSVKVLASKHPLRDDWVEAEVADGQTIRQIVGDVPVHAWVNGHEVPAALLERTWPKAGTTLIVRPVPRGDNAARIAAQVGVIILAAVAAYFGGPFAATAVLIAGNLAINYFLPPQLPGLDRNAESFNRLAAFTGQSNKIAAFTPIPRLYGEFRFFPPIPMTALPYTELQGSDQYLRMLLVLGYGPLEIGGVQAGGGAALITESSGLTGTPIRIGDTDIAAFDDVEFEIGDPADVTLFSNQVIETNPAWTTEADVSSIGSGDHGQWVTDGDSALRTTDTGADEISIDITFPGGLFSIGKKGDSDDAKVEWKIEYKLTTSGTWTTLIDPWTLESSKRETFRVSQRWKVATGQYDVQITRIRTWNNDFEGVSNQATWTALRTIRAVQPFVVPNTVVMALRMRATDQLQGRLENINVEATSILPTWDGSSWVDQATRTPAWIYADILTGTANADPLDKSKLDTTELTAWATETAADGRHYDGVFDDNATVFNRLQEVATTGRASFGLSDDAKVSIVRDTVQTTPKMVISPRNSFSFSSTLAFAKPPHAYRVRFIDPTTYEDSERIAYDDGYTSANATRFEVLQTKGVKDADQAWKDGRYHLAQQRLRPETFSFSQDVQHLRYRRGDLLSLRHDVILVGLGAGRVKSVAENLMVTSGDGIDLSTWAYNASEVTGPGVLESGWYRVTHVSGSSGGGMGIRGKVNESALIDGETYTVSVDVWNDGATSSFVHLDWCDQDGTLVFVEPGQQLRLYTNATLPDYTSTDRFMDICPTDNGGSILLRNPQVTRGVTEFPFGNGTVPGFDCDEKLFMEAGKAYAVKIQLSDGSLTTANIITTSPYTTSPAFLTPISGLSVGDHFVFGESGSESIDVKVSKIEPSTDFIARITCVPAAPDILDAETGEIPDYVPVLTQPIDVNSLPPPVPTLETIRSDERAMVRDIDGSYRIALVLFTSMPSAPGSHTRIQARIRDQAGPGVWSTSQSVDAGGGVITLTDVVQGVTYEIQVRSLREGKASAWSTAKTDTIAGKTALPPDVESFVAQQNGSNVVMRWAQILVRDLKGYELRYMSQNQAFAWDQAKVLSVVTRGTQVTTAILPPGKWFIGNKAVDTADNYSSTATVSAVEVLNAFDVVFADEQSPDWPGTLDGFDIIAQPFVPNGGFDSSDISGWTSSSTLAYDAVEGDTAAGCLTVTGGGTSDVQSLAYLPVDTSRDYTIAGSFKIDGAGATLYAGFACYDAQQRFIEYEASWRDPVKDTTLHAEALAGATQVDIVPAGEDWFAGGISYIQFGIETNGSDLPAVGRTYRITSIDKSAGTYWRLTLTTALATTYAVGAKIGNSTAGSGYNYILMVGATAAAWTAKTATISGVQPLFSAPPHGKFRVGTAFIRFLVLPNRDGGTTTYIDDVLIEPVSPIPQDALAVLELSASPPALATYTAPFLDAGFVDNVRVWAETVASAPVGEVADPELQIRFSLGETDSALMWSAVTTTPMWGLDIESLWQAWGGWQDWTVGMVKSQLVQHRITYDPTLGNPTILGFKPVVDVLPHSEGATDVAVTAGGLDISFAKPFHSQPIIKVTVVGAAVLPVRSSTTTTGFHVDLYDLSGTAVSGTIDWEASTG